MGRFSREFVLRESFLCHVFNVTPLHRYSSRSGRSGATSDDDDDDSGRPVGVVKPTRVKSAPGRRIGLHSAGKTKFNTKRPGFALLFLTFHHHNKTWKCVSDCILLIDFDNLCTAVTANERGK